MNIMCRGVLFTLGSKTQAIFFIEPCRLASGCGKSSLDNGVTLQQIVCTPATVALWAMLQQCALFSVLYRGQLSVHDMCGSYARTFQLAHYYPIVMCLLTNV